jgi:hypothetical protein
MPFRKGLVKKRATKSNYLRLLKLPAEIQLGIISSAISMAMPCSHKH